MKRTVLQKNNKNPNFIGSWMIEPTTLCDRLMDYFETNHGKQKKGSTASGMNLGYKNSTDISVSPNEISLPGNEIFEDYFKGLFECHKDYIAQWPFLEKFAENLEIGKFNLQRYQSGEHFSQLHTERSSLSTLHRLFAWMTYLNDVNEDNGGSTYFSHYGVEVQPRKGLTLIWPAEWTHAHRGEVVKEGSKYSITGWMHFSK